MSNKDTVTAMQKSKTDDQSKLFNELMGKSEEPLEFKSVDVEKKGTQIIIPDGMTYEQALTWIERKKNAEEKVINFSSKIKAYPYDGAYALYRAINDLFGFADLTATGPSDDVPPEMININLPDGSHIEVPWGRISFPGLDDDCYVDTKFDNSSMEFIISGPIKQKFEPIMRKLAAKTFEILKHDSIYKGKAIRVNLDFMDSGDAPTHPEFMNVSKIKDDDILLSDKFKMDYSSVMMRIERTAECRENNIGLKHGCLLAGPYGTGKTLTARWTAKKATMNDWTFLYIEDSRQLKNALRLAEMYAPAIIFSEDIDKAMEGSRSVEMNEILNTLDGIDTKNQPIITILTTNHVENINKAFLRAGRIDSLIHMGPLDEKTALQFITQFSTKIDGKTMLKEGDYTAAAKSLAGIVPAFASEVISKAKMFAFYNSGKMDLIGPRDIELASKSFKDHIKLTENTIQMTNEEKLGHTLKDLFSTLEDC